MSQCCFPRFSNLVFNASHFFPHLYIFLCEWFTQKSAFSRTFPLMSPFWYTFFFFEDFGAHFWVAGEQRRNIQRRAQFLRMSGSAYWPGQCELSKFAFECNPNQFLPRLFLGRTCKGIEGLSEQIKGCSFHP